MTETVKPAVLFVCLGNICRSPTAEAVFRQRAEQAGLDSHLIIDSAGTGDWHIGRAPDRRATEAAARRGYRMDLLRARQVTVEDFQRFDLILCMDHSNFNDVSILAPAHCRARVARFLEVLEAGAPEEVPDPYYGGEEGFDQVLDLVERASDLWLEQLRASL